MNAGVMGPGVRTATTLVTCGLAAGGGGPRRADKPRASGARSRAGRQRLAAAEEEVRAAGIADRPVAGVFVQFQQRQALVHRHDVVVGDRVRLRARPRKRGRARYCRATPDARPASYAGRTRLARPRRRRGRALGAAGKPEPMNFADHGIARHIAEFRGDLAGRKPDSQSFLSCSTRSSVQVNTVIAIFPSCRAAEQASAAILNRPKFLRQNPLALAGPDRRTRTSTRTQDLERSEPPHEMSYPTSETLQYGVTRRRVRGR